ncbi:MAG TPA: choice-of-anchor tandem repeat GloVer-containing protein [Candidatus Binataceae bacterium]|nr:choice-of-anchor tandem repeat GloVer-containing protein [Candidatus Binataceae bacterium]
MTYRSPICISTTTISFGGKGSGATPQGLTLLSDDYYGTTASGGANNLGTVYKMTSAGEQTVLHSFAAGADGQTPVAGLSNDSDGNLYGVTYYGGTDNFGTIFRIAPDGSGYATVHSFVGGATDGQYPGVKLRNVADGTLYGSTSSGGAGGLGTIFRYDPSSGVTTVIHSFSGPPDDGQYPSCRLRVGNDGNLYGVTLFGGYFDLGTFFRITPAGVLTVLYSFSGGADGQGPDSSLILTSDGVFYGTTVTGGPTNNGTIYRITP